MIHETCHLCVVSHTDEGNASDQSLAELAGSTLPPGSCLYQDQGFQGCVLPGSTIVQPKKKPPGGGLTPPEQVTKRWISSIRIRIDHAIGGVKHDCIVKDNIRLLKDSIRLLKDSIRDTIMETCGGLHNFR